MSIEIEKGIPLDPRGPGGPPRKYPFPEMEVGDSFFIIGTTTERFNVVNLTRRLKPRKFVSRTVMKDGQKGVRVWRIE